MSLSDCAPSGRWPLRGGLLSTPHFGVLALLFVLACQPVAAGQPCKMAQLAEFPVTMVGTQPIMHALINGTDASLLADSGAFVSMLTPAAATEYKLPLTMAPFGMYVSGVGGSQTPAVAMVKEFTLLGVKIPNFTFLVAGNDLGAAVGVLGQNLFRLADTEYDLASGAIRLMRPVGDCKGVGLVYWASSYSQIEISLSTARDPHTVGYAYVNGKKIRVLFDTGASTSVLSMEAAKSAGVTPASEDVVAADPGEGIGQHYVRNWIAPFHSFKIGDEEIRDTRLRIGEIGNLTAGAEMLLGADFFLSHRIYVANSRSKLYFTYNGGPVFNLGLDSSAAKAKSESIALASGGVLAGAAEPKDAAAYSRRATAAVARQNYASAIADMNRAVELAPSDPNYRYQRGMALWESQQHVPALADFNEALKLKPDHVPSLLARAQFRVDSDLPAAAADLEAADRALAPEAAEHMEIANTYEEAELLPAALVQYSKWIGSHERTDVRMPQALNGRCWTRALLNQELDAALADCTAALKLQPKAGSYLDSRALVYLRMGKYDKSVADYDAALVVDPKSASTRYCRGIARIRQGHAVEGQADIVEAITHAPKVADFYTRHGITP